MADVFDRANENELSGDTKERRAVDFVRRFMQKSKDYRQPHIDLAKESRELYECWSTQARTTIQRASLKLPYAYTIIESQLPQLSEVFLKEKPLFRFMGRSSDDFMWEGPLTDFHSSQLDEMQFGSKFIPFCKALLLDGTAVAKIPYRYEERQTVRSQIRYDEMTGNPFISKQPEIQVVFDGPDFEQVPLVDFFPDPNCKSPGDLKSMRGFVHRTWVTYSSLKSRGKNGQYKNLDELKTSLTSKEDAWTAPYWSVDNDKSDFDHYNDNKRNVKDQDLVEVWEFWGLFDPKNDGNFEEYVITIANGDCVLRCDANFYDLKFRPFIASVNIPRDGEFYGIPETAAVKGTIREATTLRNARLDQTNLAVNRMWIADRAAGIKANNLFTRPNGIVWTNDINGIKLMDVPEVPASSMRENQDLQLEIQNATGLAQAAPAISQLAKTFGRSATGAQLVQSFAASRMGVKIRLLAELGIKRMARIMFSTNRQFVDDQKWVRVSDPELAQQNPFALLLPDAFDREFDFEITSPLDGSASEDFQKLQQFMQFAQIAESTQPGTLKFDVIFDDMGRSLLGRRVRKFTRTLEERQAMQQQQLMAEQAANAQAGQMAPQPNAPGGQGNVV